MKQFWETISPFFLGFFEAVGQPPVGDGTAKSGAAFLATLFVVSGVVLGLIILLTGFSESPSEQEALVQSVESVRVVSLVDSIRHTEQMTTQRQALRTPRQAPVVIETRIVVPSGWEIACTPEPLCDDIEFR